MIAYKQTRQVTLKWIVGVLVFMLAMSVTFSEAEGIHLPPGNVSYLTDTTTVQEVVGMNVSNYEIMPHVTFSDAQLSLKDQNSNSTPSTTPTAVPEPGTLLLIGSGLAALYALKRNNIS